MVALACALLVVSAGCAGLTGSGDGPTTDATPPAAASTTERAEQLPPGVTGSGVENASALAAAHLANVENETFRSRNTIRRTNESGTAYRNATFSMTTESEWRYTRSQGDAFPSTYLGPRFDAYADGERMLYRIENETGVRYGVYQHHTDNGTTVPPADEVFEASYRQFYQRGFVYSLASRAGKATAVGNDTVRLTGTADDLDLGSPEVTNVSVTLTVAADGLVERIHLTFDHANEPATFEQTLTFATNVTDPVDRPDWYGTALNRTAANATA
jgi:hypothetical protein